MKSTILSLLPLASLAVAESVCSRKTVTHTEYEKVYETVKAADVTAKSSTCSRRTVTATTYEKVYVTVTPNAVEDVTTVDVTSTSTLEITTTITVHPSAPYANSSSGPYYPTIGSQSVQPEYSIMYTPVPLSEVPNPTSVYEAPTESTAAPEPTNEAAQVAETAAAASNEGEATFYGGNVAGGMCSFTGYTIPSGIFGTALSDSNWSGAANCGACVEVTGPSGTKITAMVVDQCPGCGPNHLDLFPDAFAKLADPSKGVIPVSWDIVPCGITSPIVLKNKEGTSKYWFSMQVMNSNVGVSKLEVSTDGGNSWQSTTRKDYNFFENPSGFGTDSVDVKVTSVNGGSIVVKDVSIAASSTKTGGSNFA
ncbi:Nn.00g068610.m01.CDS01 [Neocucurbitaria sp. VM-36]